ncbi:MAG TPA: hypothetical protein VGV89_06720 [Thermoplasmata archaeon]|nr:hypothetical protein [Thermoplasmata archaeon]
MSRWIWAALAVCVTALIAVPTVPGIAPEGSTVLGPPHAGRPVALDPAAYELEAARGSLGSRGGPGAAAHWSEVSPSLNFTPGDPPPLMAYDAADGYVVLLGGFCGQLSFLPTWTFGHGKWTELRTTGPPGDYGSAMAYDPPDREVVLFGQSTAFGGGAPVNITWVFHGGNWTSLSPGITHAPSSRLDAALSYDAADGYLLLYGGGLGDTWKFSGGVWTKLLPFRPTGPGIRNDALMAYNAALGEVVLIGGTALHQNNRSITWAYRSGRWSPLSATPPPSVNALSSHADCLAYDARLGVLVMVEPGGGINETPARSWKFNGSWTKMLLPREPRSTLMSVCTPDPSVADLLLLGTPTWALVGRNWSPIGGSLYPVSADGSVMTYDGRDAEVVFWGAFFSPTSPGLYGQTWTYAHHAWTWLRNLTVGPPGASAGPSMTYDAGDGYVLFFAGEPNQTWSFAAGHWTQRTGPVAPSPRALAAVAYDARDGFVVLFGGTPCNISIGQHGCPEFNETWTYVHGHWSRLVPGHGTSPPGRETAVLVYDSADRYLLLFGGTDCRPPSCFGLNDSWQFHGGNWSILRPASAPRPFVAAASTYDAHIAAVVVFGGCTATNGYYGPAYSRAAWTFSGGHWTPVNSSSTYLPIGRCSGLMAYVPGSGGDLFTQGGPYPYGFGGEGFNDLWWLRLS